MPAGPDRCAASSPAAARHLPRRRPSPAPEPAPPWAIASTLRPMLRLARTLFAVALLSLAGAASAHATTTLVSTTADVRLQGPAVQKSFLGFSQDATVVPSETGTLEQGVNPILVQLYRNLSDPGGGTPVLRMGGTDFDAAWWNPGFNPNPFGLKWDLTPDYFQAVSHFLSVVHGKAILGVNFAINNPQIAVDEVHAAQRYFAPGQILSYEIGNEPHVYFERPLGTRPDGTIVYTRSKRYNNADYLREVEPYLRRLIAIRPRPPLSAPGFCCDPWLFALPKLLKRDHRKLAFVGLHRYPLLGPHAPGDFVPGPNVLLAEDVFHGNLVPLQRAVVEAAHWHKKVRLTETNSITSGGVAGTSDRFAAALWGSDWLFGLAAIGITGANFHEVSPRYQAFATRFEDGQFTGNVKPLYYGMLLFAHATPHRSRLLPTSYVFAKQRKNANVHVWGLVDKVDRVVRIAVINKGGYDGPARVTIPFATGPGTLERLRAPAVDAATGITWAGQGFAFPTLDGKLVGDHQSEVVRRGAGNRYTFQLPAVSAALLTVPVSTTRAQRTVG